MAAQPILVTGAAGFIGFHVARRLLDQGRAVIGIDNLNAYYDPALKEARLAELARSEAFSFRKLDLKDRDGVAALFAEGKFARVVHLAAQAGVRHSLDRAARLHQFQHHRLPQRARGLPAYRHRAPHLCVVLLGLWRQHGDAASACRRTSIIR